MYAYSTSAPPLAKPRRPTASPAPDFFPPRHKKIAVRKEYADGAMSHLTGVGVVMWGLVVLGRSPLLSGVPLGGAPPHAQYPFSAHLSVETPVIDRADLGSAIRVRGCWTWTHPRPSGLGHFR